MIVVGLGNEFRHDDAVGLIAVRRLRERGVPAEEHESDVTALIDQWKRADSLILIDAVASGAAPGTVHSMDASVACLNRGVFKNSTHALDLADAVELSRTLGTLPARVFIFGVEVRDVSAGLGLSPEVESALPILMEEVLKLHEATW